MEPRIVLHAGPGGGGRSVVAAATARRIAASGTRTLLLAADPARGLEAVLGAPAGAGAPRPVGGGVAAEQLDAQAELERAGAALGGPALAARLLAPPGADALAGLLRLAEHPTSGAWDAIVVDGPAPGEALRLLALPDLARGWLDRLGGEPAHAERPFARVALDVALPGGEALDALAGVARRLVAAADLLRDAGTASVRLVLVPGRAPLDVTRRLLGALCLQGLAVDAVVLNRAQGPPGEVEAAFAPRPVLRAPTLAGEARGPEALDALGGALFAAHDPAAVLHADPPERLEVGAQEAGCAWPRRWPGARRSRCSGSARTWWCAWTARSAPWRSRPRCTRTARRTRVADGELTVTLEAP
jgi:arsenite-transporting ATPase